MERQTVIALLLVALAIVIIFSLFYGCRGHRWGMVEGFEGTPMLTPKEQELFEDLSNNKLNEDDIMKLVKSGVINDNLINKFLATAVDSFDGTIGSTTTTNTTSDKNTNPVPLTPAEIAAKKAVDRALEQQKKAEEAAKANFAKTATVADKKADAAEKIAADKEAVAKKAEAKAADAKTALDQAEVSKTAADKEAAAKKAAAEASAEKAYLDSIAAKQALAEKTNAINTARQLLKKASEKNASDAAKKASVTAEAARQAAEKREAELSAVAKASAQQASADKTAAGIAAKQVNTAVAAVAARKTDYTRALAAAQAARKASDIARKQANDARSAADAYGASYSTTTVSSAQPSSQAEAPAEPSVQPPAEAVAEPPAEPTAQPPAQPPVQLTVQPPAEPTLQSPAEPTLQSPAEPTVPAPISSSTSTQAPIDYAISSAQPLTQTATSSTSNIARTTYVNQEAVVSIEPFIGSWKSYSPIL